VDYRILRDTVLKFGCNGKLMLEIVSVQIRMRLRPQLELESWAIEENSLKSGGK